MSRAFVKEDAGQDAPLPDRPLSRHPNVVTPSGLAALRRDLAAAEARLAALRGRADRSDRDPEKVAERDIRYFEARLASAIPVDMAAQPEGEVAFGATVTVIDGEGARRRFRIVGEDEADPARGWITAHSPLGRGLIGLRQGETADWKRPGGTITLEVVVIGYDQETGAQPPS